MIGSRTDCSVWVVVGPGRDEGEPDDAPDAAKVSTIFGNQDGAGFSTGCRKQEVVNEGLRNGSKVRLFIAGESCEGLASTQPRGMSRREQSARPHERTRDLVLQLR